MGRMLVEKICYSAGNQGIGGVRLSLRRVGLCTCSCVPCLEVVNGLDRCCELPVEIVEMLYVVKSEPLNKNPKLIKALKRKAFYFLDLLAELES